MCIKPSAKMIGVGDVHRVLPEDAAQRVTESAFTAALVADENKRGLRTLAGMLEAPMPSRK